MKFRTLNGIGSTSTGVITPFPKEFYIPGTLSWKVINISSQNYDAIIGQKFLKALIAKIDLNNDFIQISDKKILFEVESPYHINTIQTIEDTDFNCAGKFIYIFGTNTRNRARPRTYSKLWSA